MRIFLKEFGIENRQIWLGKSNELLRMVYASILVSVRSNEEKDFVLQLEREEDVLTTREAALVVKCPS